MFTKDNRFVIILEMQKQKFLFKLLPVLLAALLLTASLGGFSFAAHGETVLAPGGYWYFDAPASISVTNDRISVLDGTNDLVSFDLSGAHKDTLALVSATKKVITQSALIRMTASEIYIGEVKKDVAATDLAVGGNRLFAASGSEIHTIDLDGFASDKVDTNGANITSIAANGQSVYYIAKQSGADTLWAFDGTNSTALRRFKSDVGSIACLSENSISYTSGKNIYFYDAKADNTVFSGEAASDIIAQYAFGGTAYFLTASGDVCSASAAGGIKTVITNSGTASGFLSAPTAITSRKGLICVTEYDANRISVIKGGKFAGSITVYEPAETAIDYSGNIYVAASHTVKVYSSALEPIHTDKAYAITGNINNIVSVAIDYADPVKNTLYAVTDDGKLANITENMTVNGNYSKIRFSPSGELYAMSDAGEITLIDKTALTRDTSFAVLSFPGAVDFAVDVTGNIFVAYPASVTEYVKANGYTAGNIFDKPIAVGGIAVSMVEESGVEYGDILVTDTARNCILSCDGLAAEMTDSADYNAYYDNWTDNSARAVGGSIIYEVAIPSADIYQMPVEMPAIRSFSAQTRVIVIDAVTYDASDYWFVLIDTSGGTGVYGFVNKNTLSDNPVAYTKIATSNKCTLLAQTPIWKYPSQAAAIVETGTAETELALLTFITGYTDASGNEWYRIAYDNGAYEGFVLRGSVSVDGNVIVGSEKELPRTNAHIKAVSGETYVDTFEDAEGKSKSDMTIAVDTQVRVKQTFNLSKDYTEIEYSYKDDSGKLVVRTCYVSTQNIYYSETTVYQIIAFVAIFAIIILTIALFIIKKRKENVLSDKQPRF